MRNRDPVGQHGFLPAGHERFPRHPVVLGQKVGVNRHVREVSKVEGGCAVIVTDFNLLAHIAKMTSWSKHHD